MFENKEVDAEMNQTYIVLILKVRTPTQISDYRPISLVGCIYKLFAKVLSRRMKSVMNDVIGEAQFAFCAGKQILDCFLISNEIIANTRSRGLKGVVFKADFEKAYDSVSWDFLFFLMNKMGFGEQWYRWIRWCVCSAQIAILVNGSLSRYFAISRGLRQGCPLSPLLFNIVAEGLSAFLRNAATKGYIRGLKVGSSEMEISHLQYADDLILFSEASEMPVKNMVRLLRGFELVSGLRLNLCKSKILGINIDEGVVNSWARWLHCQSESFPTMYLGLPLGQLKNSAVIWNPVLEKVGSKLSGWKSKLLSFGGRLTLIKSVLSTIPVYYMSIFPMPVSISKKLTSMITKFLWGSSDNRPIYWVSWENLCLPKEECGIGLMEFKSRSEALRCKWLWRFGTESGNLWRRTLATMYGYDNGALLPNNLPSKSMSWVWKNVAKFSIGSNSTFQNNIRFCVGDGSLIQFWSDDWLGLGALKIRFPRMYALASKKDGPITDFGSEVNGRWEWKVELRRRLFDWELDQ
ncbi:hypothetical protein HRI_003860300 [Hibiscus trionum]|uniref:Reverse transcriptase domain-containing protein n=1 Tax=Hibiscus trionum TaxID=183268 RepID=A0A9W7IT81_HIBTR|nr:hypothetical protein HRI_003860300 [Hibiscus trionum]